MKQRLYFGHPVNSYGSQLETELLRLIIAAFPDWDVENPNQPVHQEGYARWRQKTGRPMDYYAVELLPRCDGGIFLPFRDGAWGAGVYMEAQCIAARGRPVWEIAYDGTIRQAHLDAVRVLTVEETRARLRDAQGVAIPF